MGKHFADSLGLDRSGTYSPWDKGDIWRTYREIKHEWRKKQLRQFLVISMDKIFHVLRK